MVPISRYRTVSGDEQFAHKPSISTLGFVTPASAPSIFKDFEMAKAYCETPDGDDRSLGRFGKEFDFANWIPVATWTKKLAGSYPDAKFLLFETPPEIWFGRISRRAQAAEERTRWNAAATRETTRRVGRSATSAATTSPETTTATRTPWRLGENVRVRVAAAAQGALDREVTTSTSRGVKEAFKQPFNRGRPSARDPGELDSEPRAAPAGEDRDEARDVLGG